MHKRVYALMKMLPLLLTAFYPSFVLGSDDIDSNQIDSKPLQKMNNAAKPEYKLEILREEDVHNKGNYVEKEIKFHSSDGKVIKTIPYRWKDRKYIAISPNKNYLIQAKEYITSEERKRKIALSFFNSEYNERWKKEFLSDYSKDSTNEGDAEPYFFKISGNGERIVLVRTHDFPNKEWWCDLSVFDTLGAEICSVRHIPTLREGSASDIEISYDGKIVVAYLQIEDKEIEKAVKYFLFLNVDNGKSVLSRAEGVMDGKKWGASFIIRQSQDSNFPPIGKVFIGVTKKEKNRKKASESVERSLQIEEIPNDLSTLLYGRSK